MVRKHLTTSEVKHNSPSVSQNKPSDYEVEYDGIFDWPSFWLYQVVLVADHFISGRVVCFE